MRKKIFLISIPLLFFLAVFLSRTLAKELLSVYTDTNLNETETALLSDAGEIESYSWDEQKVIEPAEAPAFWALTELALDYNNQIPFADGGRYGRTGYPVIADGVDNRHHPKEERPGMDSLGYIMWIYRNLFGQYDERLDDPISMYQETAVDLSELRVGDIGMISLEAAGNHYGICIGFQDGLAVFSHSDSAPHALYPGGVNRLTFLASQTDQYLEGQAPENFQYFFRPDAAWESVVYE